MIARAAALAAVAALAAAGPAQATVSVGVPGPSDPRLLVTADGADDSIRLSVVQEVPETLYVLHSRQAITRAGTFCEPPTTSSVPGFGFVIRCRANDPAQIQVSLGAGADAWQDLRIDAPFLPKDPIAVSGGPGADSISGEVVARQTFNGDEGDDVIKGGGNGDLLSGGPGNDRLDDDDIGGRGNRDTLSGGPDNDTLVIRGGNDVARGEDGSDEVVSVDDPDVGDQPLGDEVSGGNGSDIFSLVRDRAVSIRDVGGISNLFSDGLLEEAPVGFEGYRGTRGPDTINGTASSASTGQFYNGRGGPDVLVGTDAADVIFGGDGSDRIAARNGNDVIDAKDGEPVAVPDALIDCGAGTGDQAVIDLLDPEPVGCETFARSAIGEGPHPVIGTVRRARRGAWAVRVRCPRALGHPCRGTLKLGSTRRNAARGRGTRYRIRHGRRATLRVRLRGRGRRRAFVRSVERGDVTGRKTTLGLRLLRRR